MNPFQHLFFLALITLITAVAIATIRLRAPRRILRETARFFVTVIVGIGILALVVAVLELLFVRPPL